MPRRSAASRLAATLTRATQRNLQALTRATLRNGKKVAAQMQRAVAQQHKPPPGAGDWLSGTAVGPAGVRRYHLFKPAGLVLQPGEKLPLLVMLHGCGQHGRDFAASTRMNRVATRERCLVLYPEQDRLAQAQGCWNWFELRSGKALAEAATLMVLLEQVILWHAADRQRVAVVGLSAGASMAALLASRYPARFQAVAMHSGVSPGLAHSPATALGAMRGQRGVARAAHAVGQLRNAAGLGLDLPPLLVIHGEADHVVAASNARTSAAIWALASGAAPGPERTLQRGQRYPMRVTDYRREGQVQVSLCQIEGLGHAWSGGGAKLAFSDAAGPDATRLVWTFVARQFQRPETARR
ncbi:phospholipase [Rhodococcus sp. SRB_17]|nr:phospholipase [Rhodococcus sp. SRB_17]